MSSPRSEGQHRIDIQRAYAEAVRRLKAMHLDEFHAILAEVYEERGLEIVKRASRLQPFNNHTMKVSKK